MPKIITLLFTITMLHGCNSGEMDTNEVTDRDNSITEITNLVEQQRISNETGDLSFIMSIYPDTLTVVSHGNIYQPKKAEVTKRRRQQFKESTFAINNLAPPIVNASNDGSLGWAITKIQRVRKNIHTGETENSETTSALIVFRKFNGKWVIEAVAETYK